MGHTKLGKIVSIVFCVVVLARLFQIQVINHSKSIALAKSRTTSVVVRLPSRGEISDSTGKLLAKEEQGYDIEIPIGENSQNSNALKSIQDSYPNSVNGNKYLIRGLKFDSIIEFEFTYKDLLKYNVKTVRKRIYPYGDSAGVVLGYCNLVNEEQVNRLKAKRLVDLDNGGFIQSEISIYDFSNILSGRTGIEFSANEQLSGGFGITLVERDVRTKNTENISDVLEPINGLNLKLTIDIELQKQVEEITKQYNKPVGVCVLKTNGNIKVMSSTPGYDPNHFSYPVNNAKVNQYLKDTQTKPLINRCISAYPPASVFKIFIAAAALHEGALKEDEQIDCKGVFGKDETAFRCWIYRKHGIGHGQIDLKRAIATSCNIFFFELAKRLGHQKILEWIKRFNFGNKCNIQLPFEKQGSAPEGKLNIYEVMSLGVGQGQLLTTPIQIAAAANSIATRGRYHYPTLLSDNQQQSKEIGINQQLIEIIVEGMKDDVNKSYGMAKNSFLSQIDFAGKTGSAELTERVSSHAWFAGFFPSGKPEYTVTVFVEHGGAGGDIPVKITEQICRLLVQRN